jgi:serine/threonine-protein kinase ULK/ATG1
MLFGVCPFESKSIAMLISTIKSNEISLPTETNAVSEKTQNLIKKLLTKDYFRRISWIELFGYKIDE